MIIYTLSTYDYHPNAIEPENQELSMFADLWNGRNGLLQPQDLSDATIHLFSVPVSSIPSVSAKPVINRYPAFGNASSPSVIISFNSESLIFEYVSLIQNAKFCHSLSYGSQ